MKNLGALSRCVNAAKKVRPNNKFKILILYLGYDDMVKKHLTLLSLYYEFRTLLGRPFIFKFN
jgi:hypothetical protein